MKSSYFTKTRNVYWSSEYEDLVNFLTGIRASDRADERAAESKIFELNVHVIVFAAIVGVLEGRHGKEISGTRKEINSATFEGQQLDDYIFLVALLSEEDVNLNFFRDEAGEERALRVFEAYANGGLGFLMEKLSTSLHQEPEQFLMGLLRDYKVAFTPSPDAKKKSIQLFT
jgi:dnd system-associated protein 4